MKPIERDRRRGGRPRYRTASTDRASRPIDLPQQMVGWDMVFQAEVLEQPLRRAHHDGQYRSDLRRRRTQALRVIRAIASEVTRTRP